MRVAILEAFSEKLTEGFLSPEDEARVVEALGLALSSVEDREGPLRGSRAATGMKLEWGVEIDIKDHKGRVGKAYTSSASGSRSYALEMLEDHKPNTMHHGMLHGEARLVCRGAGEWEVVVHD